MNWRNSYVKFALVFLASAVFFMGFYYIFSPVQNCIREITTHNQIVLDSYKERDVEWYNKMQNEYYFSRTNAEINCNKDYSW